MAIYNSGSVRVRVGYTTVRGNNTRFDLYASAGNTFKITDEGAYYTISSVTNATNLLLSANYSKSGYSAGDYLDGQSYQIIRDYTIHYKFPEASPSDRNVSYIYTKGVRMMDDALYNASVRTVRVSSFAMVLNGYYIWVDGTGKLRIKLGVPSSKTDGTIVGTQS